MDGALSKNETKNLSTLDKTKNGSPRADTSTSAVPMNISKPNKTRVEKFLLTPPEEKRSVSFDPSVTTLSIPNDNTFLNYLNGFNSPVESIDISVHDCDEEIYVALKERDTEMKELVVRNQEFFDLIKQSIFEDDKRWEEFLKVLYSKREDNPDSKWMESISEYLADNPHFLANFKQITGYYEHDSDITDDYDDLQEEHDDNYSCMMNESTYVDITPIRNFPYVLKNLEKNYPQLFINAKNELGKLSKEKTRRGSTLGRNHLSNDNPHLHPNVEDQSSDDDSSDTLYDELKRILITPRSELNDMEWETAVYECLDPWPTLLAQLEEIFVFEIRQNTFEE